MSQITRDNHFVPQLYLKQWSEDGNWIWVYRILVSHKNVPMWNLRPIRGVASHRDLYTTLSNGSEIDEFERWIESEYEQPAQEAIEKVIHNKPLTSIDWERLALFLAAQDVRTPTSYLESMERWENTLPDLLQNTLNNAVQLLKQSATHKMPPVPDENHTSSFFQKAVQVEIMPGNNPSGKIIRAEMVAGRALWLESQRFLLTKTAQALLKHKWSIAEPADGIEWFTSDHPVVRLNYYGDAKYDLKGGWGNPGTDLIMPLSPHHLLFTEIGAEAPDHFTFSHEKTIWIQQFQAERALRWIYASKPMKNVLEYRPRHVDSDVFKAEQEQLRKWHEEQSQNDAER